MPRIKRRHFLQAAGSSLAAIGLSQLDVFRQAEQYGKVLAQSSQRKLALLVGINGYPESVGSLQGCLTDLEMQYELLRYRYGFAKNDILVLADRRLSFLDYEPEKPTRQNILNAFQKHLIDPSTPDSVVVFHYSGHGSLIPDPLIKTPLLDADGKKIVTQSGKPASGTIVPLDRYATNGRRSGEVQDIMGRSLFLLMRSLKTNNVTAVLDSCHSGGGTRGNVTFRAASRLTSQDASPSEMETEFQKRLIQDRGLKFEEIEAERRKDVAKGVAIGSARYNQQAADSTFGNSEDGSQFHAGAFTYALTRYLWQQSVSDSFKTTFVNLQRSTQVVASNGGIEQIPIVDGNPQQNLDQPFYFLSATAPYAEAVVRSVEANETIRFWLGGLSSVSLERSEKSIFSAIDGAGNEIGEIEQEGRRGMVGTGKLRKGDLNAIKPGVLLREQVRGLKPDFKLRIGLDPSLGKDLEAAKQLLSQVKNFEVVESQAFMHYRVGRMTQEIQTASRSTNLPNIGSTGLMTGALSPLTATFRETNEGIEDAIARLIQPLKTFLAKEILNAIGGVDVASGVRPAGLSVRVDAIKPGGQVGANRFKPETPYQVTIRNNGDKSLYVAAISIGSAGRLRFLYPPSEAMDNVSEDSARIGTGEEKVVKGWQTGKLPGTVEVMVISSEQPVYDALKALKAIAARGRGVSSSRGPSSAPATGEDALEAMSALLGDLDRNTRSDSVPVSRDVKGVATRQISVISTPIEVVK